MSIPESGRLASPQDLETLGIDLDRWPVITGPNALKCEEARPEGNTDQSFSLNNCTGVPRTHRADSWNSSGIDLARESHGTYDFLPRQPFFIDELSPPPLKIEEIENIPIGNSTNEGMEDAFSPRDVRTANSSRRVHFRARKEPFATMGGRALITVVLSLMTFLNARALGSNLESRQLSLAEIPPCGIQCLFLTVPASGCGLEDFDCVCNNDGLTQTLAACMLANCTMADNLGTARVQADICNLSEESKRKEVFMYTGIVYSMAFLFVILRIAGKLVSKRLALDDWIVIAALLLAAVPLGCVLTMTKMGFGNHLWTLEDNTLLPILRFFFISWSTYVIVLGMIKVSLILFYLEIFKTRRFEISAYIILAYIIVNSLVIFFLTTFACTPVQSFWNQNIKGKCMDIQGLAYATSASAIVQDIMLLILPLVFIRNLQMKRYRKIAVGLMFTIGTFGCIATIIRLQTLLPFKISIDPTWDYVPLTVWTELELAAGFACVSLPSIRILIRLLAVKANEFLLHISARSRSNRTPKQELPAPQREWRKPWSWINVSLDINNSRNRTKGRQSFMRSLRSRNSMIPYTHHNTRSGSRRLEPTMSNYSESGVALTRPPFRNEQCERSAEQIEMLEFPSLASLRRDSHIRAVAIEASVPNKQIV